MTVDANGEELRLLLEGEREVRMTEEMYCPDLIRIQPLLLTVPVTLSPRRF